MKVKKFENIVEKVQNVKPKVSQYIFEKYLSNLINVNPKICETPPKDEYDYDYPEYLRSYYKIKYYFNNKNANLDKDNLNFLLSIIDVIESLCTDIRNTKGVSFHFYGASTTLQLILTSKIIEQIKSTKEFQDWLDSAELNYSKYKEDQIIKKSTRKYNL